MVLETEISLEVEQDIQNHQDLALVERFWTRVKGFLQKNDAKVKIVTRISIAILFNGYFVLATYLHWVNGLEIDWCGGVGMLIILTVITYWSLFYYKIFKPLWGKRVSSKIIEPTSKFVEKFWNYWFVRTLLTVGGLAAFIAWLVIDTTGDRDRLYSLLGLAAFLFTGWIFSKYPSRIQWTPVVMGVIFQFIFGLLVLRWEVGKKIFICLGDRAAIFLKYTDVGSGFVYGYLVNDENQSGIPLGAIFAFKVLSTMFLFSFIVSILYYYGVMQFVIGKVGWFLQATIGTTAAESVNCASNIFLGQTEAPLAIKPLVPLLTKSELHTVMTSGFATISGSVLSAYISFGINASHLLSASIMSAPAALAFAKLFYPETETSQTIAADIQVPKGVEENVLDAAARGTSSAVSMVLEIMASLIAFLSFVALLNGIISWVFGLVGMPFITFEFLVGKLFIPIAWVMGVPQDECDRIGHVVGLKTVVNEFAAYKQLSDYMAQGLVSKRSEIIATYALCGFSNPGSIGIQIATLGSMAPSRRGDLAQVAFRAFISGSVASFMTACVAGTLTPSL